jgi:hypothetical protein
MNTVGSDARAYVENLGAYRNQLAARGGLPPEWAAAAPSLVGVPAAEAVPMAAVLVAIDALRREAWSSSVEISQAVLDRLPQDMPGPPNSPRESSFQVLDTNLGTRAQRCTSCGVTDGKVLCIVCGGDEEGCASCEEGWIPCSACDGTAQTFRATIRHVTDRAVRLRQVFVPRSVPQIEQAFERWLDPDRDPPPALRIDLQPTLVQSAYRGAEAVGEPEFFGHRFGDAVDRAVKSVKDFEGVDGIVFRDVRAYAYPFFWLRYRGMPSEAALVVDERARPRVLVP